MENLAVMATTDKNSDDIFSESRQPIFTKVHNKHLHGVCTKTNKNGQESKFKMAAMPIYCKILSNDFFSTYFADILHDAYGASPNMKYLKSFQLDRKFGGVNLEKGRKNSDAWTLRAR